jgi:dienelactone hydrolase
VDSPPTSPAAARWLEPQLVYAHSLSGGKGVALIGMCLTGSLPLALISSNLVRAAVLCQPTNPFLFPRLTDLSAKDRKALQTITFDVLGFHFSNDRFWPEARWNFLRKRLKGRLTEKIGFPRASSPPHIPPRI